MSGLGDFIEQDARIFNGSKIGGQTSNAHESNNTVPRAKHEVSFRERTRSDMSIKHNKSVFKSEPIFSDWDENQKVSPERTIKKTSLTVSLNNRAQRSETVHENFREVTSASFANAAVRPEERKSLYRFVEYKPGNRQSISQSGKITNDRQPSKVETSSILPDSNNSKRDYVDSAESFLFQNSTSKNELNATDRNNILSSEDKETEADNVEDINSPLIFCRSHSVGSVRFDRNNQTSNLRQGQQALLQSHLSDRLMACKESNTESKLHTFNNINPSPLYNLSDPYFNDRSLENDLNDNQRIQLGYQSQLPSYNPRNSLTTAINSNRRPSNEEGPGHSSILPKNYLSSSQLAEQPVLSSYSSEQQILFGNYRHDEQSRIPAASYTMRRKVGDRMTEDLRFNERQVALLRRQGFTTGLAKALLENAYIYDHRIWVVDNSGSMQLADGTRIITSLSSNSQKSVKTHQKPLSGKSVLDVTKAVSCTRWEELQDTIKYHAQMAALMHSPTIFKLLNDTGSLFACNQFSVGESDSSTENERQVQNVYKIIQKIRPGGVTPLTHHLQGIRQGIKDLEAQLRRYGKKVVVVLATDGLPTDEQGYDGPYVTKQFVEALRSLEGLPVWVVVRLCTNEQAVRDFYNSLDEQLELSLEVLDDYFAEASEVFKQNKWLNYGVPLHRCRELGYHDRLLDLIDERTLSSGEMRAFCALLFGIDNIDDIPDPAADWRSFSQKVDSLLQDEWEQWHPIRKKMSPWIDLKILERTYNRRVGMFSSLRKS